MSCPSPSPSITLPIEVILEILALAAAENPLSARSIAQVCRLARPSALEHAYTTLAPSGPSTASISSLPDHLQPYVQNAWVELAEPAVVDTPCTSWFWSRASHLAIPLAILSKHLHWHNLRATAPVPAPSPLTHLTLLNRRSDGLKYIGLWPLCGVCMSLQAHFPALSHLRVHLDGPSLNLKFIQLFALHLPSLTHIAYDIYDDDVQQHTLQSNLVVKRRKPDVMAVLAIEWAGEMGDFVERFEPYTIQHIYVVPVPKRRVSHHKKEWRDERNGGEDIWQKAVRIRDAMERNDMEAMKS